MHAIAVRNFILIASFLAAVPALASVGGTSSGVTSSIGQGTNASPEVQQQSAGFVQQNQQLQGAQNPVSANGIVMPGGVANTTGAAGARNAANAAGPDSSGKPGDPNSASATPATPPPPPPPPPTYVSVVKHLTPGSDSADPAAAAAVTPASVAAAPAVTPESVAPAQMKSDTPPPAPAKPATPAAVASVPAAGTAANTGGNERAAETGVVSGGRGPAPDGYTFYVGFGIALLLLAIAFGAYLSSQKDEFRQRSPR